MSASTKYYYIPGNDYHKTELKISLLNNKISRLRALIELPKYARIQAMSDIEVEEYKKNKINELEGKIKEIEIIKEENKKTIAQLHERQAQLIAQLNVATGNEKANILDEGKKLEIEINKYANNNPNSVTNQLLKEQERIRKEQENINKMTSEDIKKILLSELDNLDTLLNVYSGVKLLDPSHELVGSVANDEEKSLQMAELLTKHSETYSNKNRVYDTMYFSTGLPKELEKKLSVNYLYDSEKKKVINPRELLKIIENYQASFAERKAVFNKIFNEEELSELYKIDFANDNIEFYDKHSDKLKGDELDNLKELIEKKKCFNS